MERSAPDFQSAGYALDREKSRRRAEIGVSHEERRSTELDVHAETIAVAIAGPGGEVPHSWDDPHSAGVNRDIAAMQHNGYSAMFAAAQRTAHNIDYDNKTLIINDIIGTILYECRSGRYCMDLQYDSSTPRTEAQR